MNKSTYDIHYKKGGDLLEILLSEAKYCFSVGDIQKKLGLAQNNVVKILTRLKRKNKIISVSKGLYAYFPPAEKKFGFNVIRVLSPIMAYWQVPYYVGLLSAANHYGAAHYKPQVLQVMIPKQISFRKAKELGISFHVKKNFPKEGLERIKTPFGYVLYSTPELLVLDLIGYEKAGGGIDNVVHVIRDLLPHLKSKELQKMALVYPVMAVVQRAGFIFDKLGAHKSLVNSLQRIVRKRGASLVKLSTVMPIKGKPESKWKIIQNISLENEDDI